MKFTWKTECHLRNCLACMDKDDPSELYRLAIAYYSDFRTPDRQVLKLLGQFEGRHHEMHGHQTYDPSMKWSYSTSVELSRLLSGISNPDWRSTPTIRAFQRFYDSLPPDLPWD